jgi:uncharacterized protein involved in tolerance to divalent cations
MPEPLEQDRNVKAKLIVAGLLAACAAAWASGAPWYKWQNTVDKTTLCAKTSPGDYWVVVKGPYMESTCRKPGNPQ